MIAASAAAASNKKEVDDTRHRISSLKPLTILDSHEVPSRSCCGIWRHQPHVRKFYANNRTQILVAALIVSNFIMNLAEGTIDPRRAKQYKIFIFCEHFFMIAFTVELVINMYAYWCCKFWRNPWNIFDFVVVTIGILVAFDVPLGPLRMLRMIRAFRVFRLFKRIESLRKILDSLWGAVPGVCNAFVILFLFMSIYAILAVDLFSNYGRGGQMRNEFGTEIALLTARDQEYGYEYFGTFPKALFTMFQVLTGESWSEAVARWWHFKVRF